MSSYDIYRYIFIGGAILCGVMLVVSVLLFILLKIPKVIGDLTGITAKKAIENIRNQNESSGNKTYKSSPVNKERGKITDKISPSGRLMRNPTDQLGAAMATEKIGTQRLSADETSVLDSGNETTVLSMDAQSGGNETTLLDQFGTANNETTLLDQFGGVGNETTVPDPFGTVDNEFRIEYEITYIHTQEIIPSEVN